MHICVYVGGNTSMYEYVCVDVHECSKFFQMWSDFPLWDCRLPDNSMET